MMSWGIAYSIRKGESRCSGWIRVWTLARVVVREFSWKRAVGLQKRGSGGSPPIMHLVAIFEDLHHKGLTLLNFCCAITFLVELCQPFFGLENNIHTRAVYHSALLP